MNFMNTLKSAATSAVTGSGDDKKTNTDPSSHADLMSSAKLVAEAAQNATSGQTDKIDKVKTAGAAADILDSAKEYGKFDETQGVGSYLKKADDYLREYEKSGITVAASPAETAPAAAPVEEKKEEVVAPPVEEKKEEVAAPPPTEEKKEESFGAADAFKAAGSFFK